MTDTLWITQMEKDLNDRHITELECPDGMFARLLRVFPGGQKKDLLPGCVLITRKNESGDLTDDDPICIADHNGQWLLREFFHLPKNVWGKVKVAALEPRP